MVLRVKKVALSVGIFVALLHLVYVVVLQVFGSAFLNWKMGLHFVSIPITVLPFDVVTFVTLLVVSFIGGYIVGALFAYVHNRFGR